MKVNEREQEFVFRYFQSGRLDTQRALQKVKARLGASEAEEKPTLMRVRLSQYRWIAVAASF